MKNFIFFKKMFYIMEFYSSFTLKYLIFGLYLTAGADYVA
jgi:hypothetical protein